MSRKAIALLAGLFLAALSLAGPAGAAGTEQITKEDYEDAPFMVSVPTIPQILLILSKNIQMFQQAYPGLVDMDGDGVVDTGFNPGVVYTGYFDPYSCYGYTSYTRKWSASSWSIGSPTGTFVRVGPTVADEAKISRPDELKGYVKSPVSVTGVCTGVTYAFKGSAADTEDSYTDKGKYNETGTFSGNWLNYLASSRMDVIRKILYGGSRVMPESETETYLEASFVPPDSTAWGTEVMADDIWSKVTPQSAYYDITKYTPFHKPAKGTAHFFSRTRDRAEPFQAIRMLPNASIASFNCKPDGSSNGSTDSVGEQVQGIKGRYWDWALGNRPVPDDKVLRQEVGNKARESIRTYRLVVKACEAGNVSPTEGCMQYPNGNHKPVGLLQEYGQGGKMNFGLMTGSYSGNGRKQGGIIRNHIADISRSVDQQTGKIIKDGMISNMDRLRISGRYIRHLEGWPFAAYYDTHSWGNPVGEMLFEGVRYFASLTRNTPLAPINAFHSGGDWDSSHSANVNDRIKDNNGVSPIIELTRETSWVGGINTNWPERDTLRAADCAKPVILLISDINIDYDGDNVVNDANNDLNQPVLSGLSANLPQQFNMKTYLDEITTQEKLNGNKFFFSQSSTGDCSPKTLTSLAQVKGLCPAGPAFEGTYSAAAVAYYAHTHNFSVGTNETGIDIYAVTMSSAYPELTLKDGTGGDKKISIMPVNITAGYSTNTILSFLNYYILEWHTDQQDTPFSVTIQVNFSDQPWGDDWEMDVIVTYKIDLLTKDNIAGLTTELFDSSSNMVSGALKNSGKFYGFKNSDTANTKDQFILVDPSKVVGLSVDSKIEKKGTGVNMGLGYTISGTGATFDGTYLDLGLNNNFASQYQTPPTCPRARASSDPDVGTTKCGKAHTTQRQIRTFEFAQAGSAGEFLENPLWLAAKYGGFKETEKDKTGEPGKAGTGRWDTKKSGAPDNYFQATNISELSEQLGAAFRAIARSVATGTATASSINSVLGGGVSIQTLFYPEFTHKNEENVSVKWIGNIYGLFIDKWGNLREDSNGDKKLNVITGDSHEDDTSGGRTPKGDMVIQFIPQENGPPLFKRLRDIKGDNTLIETDELEYHIDTLEDVKALWNTSWQLADMTDDQAAITGRDSYASSSVGRYIMTYFGDLPANPENGWDQPPASLHQYQFKTANKAKLAEVMLDNSALSLPVAFGGDDNNAITGQPNKMYIRAAGQLPTNVDEVKVEITNGGSNNISASLSGTTLTVTIERHATTGYAKSLVDLINSGNIYMNAPIIRASLENGDSGNWLVHTSGTETVTMDRAKVTGELIEYIRGMDKPGWRSRTVLSPWEKDTAKRITWRLGDIINSKPVIVGAPSSQFDYIYRDTSYSKYKKAQGQRRQVAYFGSNDGMLHAVNLGFFGSLEDGLAGYLEESPNKDIIPAPTPFKLGSELWAYVPPAVLPHLQWLTDPEYDHSYYVDLKPQIMDIKNTGSAITYSTETGSSTWGANEWRTVLIGGLRLGGRTIPTNEPGETPKYSYAEFFALDVTDPEVPPVLLWRFSSKELGLGTCLPTVVSSQGNWYVVLASGPNSDATDGSPSLTGPGNAAYTGHSSQKARLIILNAITGTRIKTLIAEEEKSFFNDSFTPIVSKVRNKGSDAAQWDNNVVYFGMTVSPGADGLDQGAVYRLQMVDSDGDAFANVDDWELKRMFKTDKGASMITVSSRPVSGAVNSARDSRNNLWVIFGTGRMWGKEDATPCNGITESSALKACRENHEHFIYGLKEPMQNGVMTFEEITDIAGIVDVSTVEVYENGHIEGFSGLSTYYGLQNHMFSAVSKGYRRKLATWSITGSAGTSGGTQEVCLYQPKIEGLVNGQSLAAFTTYEPDLNVCNPEGRSYLHVIDTFTGVPAPYMYQMGFLPGKFSTTSQNPDGTPAQQVTGYIDAGSGKSTEAWITGDVIGTTGQDGTPYTLKIPKEVGINSAVISWREILDMGFTMGDEEMMYKGIYGLDQDAEKKPKP